MRGNPLDDTLPMLDDDAPAVLHVTAAAGGGADRYIRTLAACTRRRHHLLHVGPGVDVLEDIAATHFVPLHETHVDGASALARWSRAAGIGIVHVHSVDERCRARLGALERSTALPYLATLHDLLFVNPRAFETDAMGVPDVHWITEVGPILERAATVVAPSAFIRDAAQRWVPRARFTLIAPGIPNPENIGDVSGARVPAPSQVFTDQAPAHVVAIVGAIGPHKGSGLLAALAQSLEGTDIGLVVIGYTDTRLARGWVVPKRLYVHGPYVDDALTGWLAAYRAEAVLFPNRLPESFSYTLSEAWAAGLPVIVPDEGALGERVARHGGGWHLPSGFAAGDAAALLARLFGPEGTAERARVKSQIAPGDPERVPTLQTMARELDRLYVRYAVLPPDAADPATAAEALAPLLAVNLDGFVFRKELVRFEAALDELNARFAESQQWNDKLEGDIATLNAEIERLGAANRALAEDKAAFDLLPRPLRGLLWRKAQRGRR